MKSGALAPPATVPEMDYVHGLQQLQLLIEQHAPALTDDFLTLEARLLDNLNEKARYGSTETLRADHARIVDSLNSLAEKAGLEPSYNDLCRK